MGDDHRPSDSATLKPDGPSTRTRQLELEIANAVVAIYKEHFGRGPTRARAVWAGPDLLVCTVEDSYTPADRRLVDMGEDQRLRENRLFVQHAASGDLIATVEQLTERRVRAYVTGMDTRADVASELFYLEPAAEADSS